MAPTSTHHLYITLALIWMSVYPCFASYDSTKASSSFPGDDQAFAVGYDNTTDTILLFGGANNNRQFIQFRDDTFISTDTTYLSSEQSSYGYGQHYVQLNDKLFMTTTNNMITVFQTRAPYESIMDPIHIPISCEDTHSCLAISDHYLFHVGGGAFGSWQAMDTVQIYDILTGEWLSGVPSLFTPRKNPGCLVINHVLYVIGGRENDDYINSIVTLDVSDTSLSSIAQQEWHYFPDTLSKGIVNIKLVRHRTDIIVVGGQTDKALTLNDVHVIDTIAGTCRLAGTLAVKTECPGIIVHEASNTLYIFGGFPSSSFDTWQYIVLPTTEPTDQPTMLPSLLPTTNPSANPSHDPTNDPTFNPTCDPTSEQYLTIIVPTDDPTVDSSTDPSSDDEKTHDQETDDVSFNTGSVVLDIWVIIGVIITGSIAIIGVALYIFNYFKQKAQAKLANDMNVVNNMNVVNIESDDNINTIVINKDNMDDEKEGKLQEEHKESRDTKDIMKASKEVVTVAVSEDSKTFSSEDLYEEMIHEAPAETKGFGDIKDHMHESGGETVDNKMNESNSHTKGETLKCKLPKDKTKRGSFGC